MADDEYADLMKFLRGLPGSWSADRILSLSDGARRAGAGPGQRAADILDRYGVGILQKKGRLFTVDIPGDEDLLDWDAPLSEQPARVKKALAALGIEEKPVRMEWRTDSGKHRLFIVDGTGEARGTSEYLLGARPADGTSTRTEDTAAR